MLIRRTLQFLIIFPVTLFLLNMIVSYLLWSSPDTSPRLAETADMLAVGIAWLIAYALFMTWALHKSGSVDGMPAARRLLYVSPLIATILLCMAHMVARFITGLPVNAGGIAFSIGSWLLIGYLYAVLASAVLLTFAYFSSNRMRVPGHGP